jgi:YbbR domain-containing protein
MISGAKTYVDKVVEVRAVVKLTDAKTDISQIITLVPVDANGTTVKEVSLSPERITVNQKVFERGGYRNVVVQVVTNGQVDDGYRLSSLSVFPPTVTVYSTDTALIDGLPGYIETKPIDLSRKNDNFEEQIDLNLPEGVQVIDDLYVLVKVDITPIIGNQALDNVPVEAMGLDVELEAEIMPQQVSAILSGPLNILQKINLADLRILLDLSGLGPGTYTLEPDFVSNHPDIDIESISPKTFNVTIK